MNLPLSCLNWQESESSSPLRVGGFSTYYNTCSITLLANKIFLILDDHLHFSGVKQTKFDKCIDFTSDVSKMIAHLTRLLHMHITFFIEGKQSRAFHFFFTSVNQYQHEFLAYNDKYTCLPYYVYHRHTKFFYKKVIFFLMSVGTDKAISIMPHLA